MAKDPYWKEIDLNDFRREGNNTNQGQLSQHSAHSFLLPILSLPRLVSSRLVSSRLVSIANKYILGEL